MRGPLAAVFCLVPGICLAQVLPGAELGAPPPSAVRSAGSDVAAGKIGIVDTIGMSFVCTENGAARTYWITQATRFRSGTGQASFFDIRTGEAAEIAFHRSAGRNIADLVRLGT